MIRPSLVHRTGAPLAVALVALLGALPARADTAPPADPIDPVVQEVVRMLAGGVGEPVIDSWLETTGRRPAHVDGRELVALQQAKASADLMKRLIRLANGGEPAPAPPPAASMAPIAPTAPPPPPSPAAPAPGIAPSAAAIPMRFEVGYRPFTTDESAPAWDLFVYLDGRFLTWGKPAMISLTMRSWSFDRALPPGRHVIRLVEERHERRRGGGGWAHAARVAPALLAFDLPRDASGEPWRVRLQLDQVKISRRGPLALRVTAGDREVAAAAGGGEPESWAALCDDVEANVQPGGAPSAEARRQLGSCVRWAGLWPGLAGVPPRAEVRGELERDRFQPPVPAAR